MVIVIFYLGLFYEPIRTGRSLVYLKFWTFISFGIKILSKKVSENEWES